MASITKFIENKLKLKVNMTKSKVCTPWDLKYLGFGYCKMKKLLIKTDEHLRARIRMIIWKQWKKPKTQIKNLVKGGYSIDEARGLAYCRKGYMFIAHSKILQNAITKEGLQNSNKKLGRSFLYFSMDDLPMVYALWNDLFPLCFWLSFDTLSFLEP